MSDFTIRGASQADLDGLLELEGHSFESDRLSGKSFRNLLRRGNASIRVAAAGEVLGGYYVLLFRAGSSIARLYSIAVHASRRGAGLAKTLLGDAERVARRQGRKVLRLEVREDNLPAIRLYERLGYRPIGRHDHYYADRTHALRYEKSLDGSGDGHAPQAEEDRSPRDLDPPFRSVTEPDAPTIPARSFLARSATVGVTDGFDAPPSHVIEAPTRAAADRPSPRP